ncbi:MAG: YggT family protein [Candidatus Latescibacteria bacterium]|jgi:YggT family protein|nr:YggT family protein [Candidatus Latescibacterota bacterium]
MLDLLQELIVLILDAVDLLVQVVVIVVVVLVLLRWLLVKVSPFGWATHQVRRITDPVLWPITEFLPVPNSTGIASLLLVIFIVLTAYFFKWVLGDALGALLGLLGALSAGSPIACLGWLLYGVVSVLLALIVARIVISWLPFARGSRLMATLYGLTEPVMAPFRQLIPPLGMFDLSPIILIFLLNFVQSAIHRILIR